jgi:hypothetical protein
MEAFKSPHIGTDTEWQNEYAKQIREYRSQEKPGKSHGKVFVRGE